MTKTFNLTGVAHWVKVIGDPVENYREDGNEWTIDVTPDQRGIELLRRVGLGEKLRNKDDDRDDFITFRRNELKKDGSANNHIEVVDAEGNPWNMEVGADGYPVTPIGNGSLVKVKFSVFEMPARGKFKALIKPVIYKITVTELKEFKKREKPAETKAEGIAKQKKAPAQAEQWAGEEEAE